MDANIKKLSPEERQMQITRILMSHDRITINEIATEFSVTTETARKDLYNLEKKGIAKRFHGGAIRQNNYLSGLFINERMEQYTINKRRVAVKAAALVPDGSTVLLDSGSTCFYLAQMLVSKKDLFVITNAISIVNLMAEQNIRTMIIGGEVFKSDLSAVGPWSEICLANITADIAFIGASGLNSLGGPSVENFLESNIKNTMIQHAKSSYVIADSSKCSKVSLVQFASWQDINGLIIDADVPSPFLETIGKETNIIVSE